ncbi:MAG: hypothetical protein ACYCZX_20065 [Rhodospirillaceae bacterium]
MSAQDELPSAMQCMRYLQASERSLQIPQGLTTAISLVETGRPVGPAGQRLPWPWTININGQGRFFETKEEAVTETRKMMDEGQRSIDVGCMQINLRYHPNAFKSLDEAFDPASNVAYGAQFLQSLHLAQGSWAKAVERYHSSDEGRRETYRDQVLALWNGDVRDMVMNAALTENTDTPYHHAVNDFARGNFVDALVKYQAILKDHPKDRLGLLGTAMSFEKLGRQSEADTAYGAYLVAAPDDEAAVARAVTKARTQPPADGRASLEALVKAGLERPEVFAALSDLAAVAGDYPAAFDYAARAADAQPSIAAYNLNAGILADRLKRPVLAVKYYENFLNISERTPVVIEASIDGVRNRARFLKTQL